MQKNDELRLFAAMAMQGFLSFGDAHPREVATRAAIYAKALQEHLDSMLWSEIEECPHGSFIQGMNGESICRDCGTVC